MVRNIIWGSTEINSRAISIQYFLCYLFYFLKSTDIASYADGTTRYNDNLIQKLVINDPEETSSILFKCFNNNYMKLNRVTSSNKAGIKISQILIITASSMRIYMNSTG